MVPHKERGANYPLLEAEVNRFVLEQRAKSLVITHAYIRQKALRIAERDSLQKFKASNCWIDRFKKRFRLSYRATTHTLRKTNLSDQDMVSHQ